MTEAQKIQIARCAADIRSARASNIRLTDDVIHIGMREKYGEACIVAAFEAADKEAPK